MTTYNIIVLDRIEPGWTPPYCTHGRAGCVGPGCGEWVWLGNKSHDIVKSGQALPLCRQCAEKHIPKGTPRTGHIDDHRRADGPH